MSFKECKLENFVEILSGYAFKSKDFINEGVPVIKIKNIIPPNVEFSDAQYVSEELYNEKIKYSLKFNDILISLTGSNVNQINSAVGKVGRVRTKNTKLLLNQRVGKVYVKDENKYSNDFLYYYLIQEHVRYDLASSAGGSANQANINPQNIKNLKISLPPIEEQKAIAKILSDLDNKIEVNNKINQRLEEMAQSIFKRWFVDFEFPNEEGKPYKSSGGEMVESELGMIPKGWEVKKISDICEIGSSKRIFMKEYVDRGIPFYRGKEIIQKSNGNVISTELFISQERYNEIKEKFGVPTKNDILLTSVGTLGVAYLVGDEEFYFKDGNLTWFKNFVEDSYRYYIYQFLTSNEGKKELDSITIGSTQKALTINSLNNIRIVIPSIDLLNKFAKIIISIRDSIRINNIENERLSNLRDILLPKLMSGEIRVPVK